MQSKLQIHKIYMSFGLAPFSFAHFARPFLSSNTDNPLLSRLDGRSNDKPSLIYNTRDKRAPCRGVRRINENAYLPRIYYLGTMYTPDRQKKAAHSTLSQGWWRIGRSNRLDAASRETRGTLRRRRVGVGTRVFSLSFLSSLLSLSPFLSQTRVGSTRFSVVTDSPILYPLWMCFERQRQ